MDESAFLGEGAGTSDNYGLPKGGLPLYGKVVSAGPEEMQAGVVLQAVDKPELI
jgi:hypothetical protein